MSSFPLLLILLPLGIFALPTLNISAPEWPSKEKILDNLQTHGVLVFTGLGHQYRDALVTLRDEAPRCLEEALQVHLDDGSERFTIARDTLEESQPFPDCVSKETGVIGAAFDLVDVVLYEILRQNFGRNLKVLEQDSSVRELYDLDSKTHLHVYKQTSNPTLSPLALPYHTDNGLYVLLTPSPYLPLRVISKDGTIQVLDTGDDSVLMLLGTGLTDWLLPTSSLHAPPHAVPALSTSLSNSPRTVLARMKVAPSLSVPNSFPSFPTFWSHFSAPLGTEKGSTLVRLRKQRSAGCSQDWPHACTHSSTESPRGKREAGRDILLGSCSV